MPSASLQITPLVLLGLGMVVPAVSVACSSSSSAAHDAGVDAELDASGSSSSSSSGGAEVDTGTPCTGPCCDLSSVVAVVDLTKCAPQIENTSSCNGTICTYTLVVPCSVDAGAKGGASDAGPSEAECAAWCADAAPSGFVGPSTSVCQHVVLDGGEVTMASCGGCGT